MTIEEGKKAIAELKSEGNSEEEILFGFYRMFQEDEIDIDVLEALTHLVGYELTDEFKNMSPEDQKTKGYKEADEEDAEEKTEEVKDFSREQGKEETEESEDEEKPEDTEKPEESEDTEESEESEEDERKKAMKLFGLNKEDK